MADKGLGQRRLEEQIQILFGARGQDADRAVRLSELSDMSSKVMAPIIATITARAEQVVTAQATQVTGSIRALVDAARQEAERVADRVSAVQTQITNVNTRIDAVLDEVAADFDAIDAQVEALNAEVAADFDAIDAQVEALNAEVAADIASVTGAVSALTSQVATDIAALNAAVAADITEINAIIDGIDTDIASIEAEIEARFGSVTDRLDEEFPRITDLSRRLDDASNLVLENAANLALLGKRVSDAGIHIDPESGRVEIYALKALDERVGAASITLDALEASINLKASFAYVDNAISNALIDPTQIPIISDFQLTLNQVQIDLNAVEASIALKADQLVVSGMAVTLGQVSIDLDAVETSLTLKASKSEFDDAVARLEAAEILIDAQEGIVLQAESYFGRFRAFEDFQYETLDSLLKGYNAREELSGAFAGAMRQIRTDTRDGFAAEASDRLTLRAEYEASTAALYVENNARATEIEAVSTQVTGVVARLDNVEADYATLAYVTTTFYAKAQVDSAIALATTTLNASIAGVSANLSANYYTRAQTDSAISSSSATLSATIAGVSSNLSTNYLTSVQTTSAIAAAQSTLQASINGVSSTLATNHYTRAQVDSAIGAVQTALTASIAGVSSNLTTNYLTSVQTNEAISAATTSLSASIGAVSSSLATNYYTKAQTDSAIGAVQTTLTASIAGVSSNLATNYLTSAQTTSAITAAQTSLTASINAVSADLDTNYFTSAETTAAISVAQTTLQSNINGVSSNLTTNYYTKAATDAAIGAVQTALNASIAGVSSNLATNYLTSAQTTSAITAAQTSLTASINAVSADLDTNYFTSAETTAAISVAQTTLQSNINGVSSNLTTNYYTKAATDAAIGAVQTALNASIAGVSSNLATNYLTSAQTNSALTALSTSLTASITGVQNNLATFQSSVASTYATQAGTDSALAGLETAFRAELNRSTPPTGFVGGGDHWTSTGSGSPEAVAAPSGTWTFASEAAAQALPSATTGAMLATRGVVPVTNGDSIRITLIARVTGSGAGINGVDFVFNWLDANYSATGIAATVRSETLVPGAFVSLTANVPAPPDAFWCRVGVAFDGTAYASGASVSVRAIKVENLSSIAEIEAAIATNFYTKAATDSAIAAGISTYDASVGGGIAANVTQSTVALAGLNGSVARFSTLVSAGGGAFNAAGIELLAWDEEGVTGSAVRLLGDDVIVPGSLTAGTLLVTDGSGELFPNWNFLLGNLSGWTVQIGSGLSVVAKTSGVGGLSTANATYVVRAEPGTGLNRIRSEKVAAKPGDRIAFNIEAASQASTTGASILMRILFYDATDTFIASTSESGSANSTTWVSYSDVAVAPANTVYCVARLDITPSPTQPLYVANASAIRQRSGATLITPNSINADRLNVTELSAITGNIGLLRSATSGERVEISNDTIKVFDAAGTLRVLIGDLT